MNKMLAKKQSSLISHNDLRVLNSLDTFGVYENRRDQTYHLL